MNYVVSTASIPFALCPCCPFRGSQRDIDRRLDRIADTLHALDARFDSLQGKMRATFQEIADQNQLILARLEQVTAGYAAIERAIIGD